MKQPTKNEADLVSLINTIQTQLTALDRKVDTLISRSLPQAKPTQPPAAPAPAVNKPRPVYAAVCADCKKDCSLPFKPGPDRPVYCKDCFSRRKVISMSKIGMDEKPKETIPAPIPAALKTTAPKPAAKVKKKAVAVKKPVAKKKIAPKKK